VSHGGEQQQECDSSSSVRRFFLFARPQRTCGIGAIDFMVHLYLRAPVLSKPGSRRYGFIKAWRAKIQTTLEKKQKMNPSSQSAVSQYRDGFLIQATKPHPLEKRKK
jgi:hypothetical protein